MHFSRGALEKTRTVSYDHDFSLGELPCLNPGKSKASDLRLDDIKVVSKSSEVPIEDREVLAEGAL